MRMAMILNDPENHQIRQLDGQRRFNPVPYNAQYFGHKLHIDLCEKLVDYGCILVGAIDGYSGFIASCFTVHRKNNIDVYRMYRELMLKFGIWDQIRTDHGREFFLMHFVQDKLKDFRFNTQRTPFVQTSSRQNRVIERVWHEINQRVIYRLKKILVELFQMSMIDTDIPIDKFVIGYCVRKLVTIGVDR